MASFWDNLLRTYNFLFDEISHPITKNWLLIPSPLLLFVILLSYNIFCLKIGPMLMKNRPPFKLETTIHFYNLFQVFISSYICYEGALYLFSGNFNFQCEGVYEASPLQENVPRTVQVYFLTKLIELLDTIFFVLRKSDRQITFLHLYHHTMMPIVSWIAIKYVPGGQPAVIGTINSFVHVFMYTYYLIAGLGPQYKKYLWWKKQLTMLQVVQFLIILIHSFNSLFYPCSYPTFFKLLSVFEAVSFTYMFSKFYYHSYIKDRRVSGTKQSIDKGTANCVSSENYEMCIRDTLTVNKKNCVTDSSFLTYARNDLVNKKYSNGKSKGNNHTNEKCDKHE